jgi:hypothetical protein
VNNELPGKYIFNNMDQQAKIHARQGFCCTSKQYPAEGGEIKTKTIKNKYEGDRKSKLAVWICVKW